LIVGKDELVLRTRQTDVFGTRTIEAGHGVSRRENAESYNFDKEESGRHHWCVLSKVIK
jgi:hypothetical protein